MLFLLPLALLLGLSRADILKEFPTQDQMKTFKQMLIDFEETSHAPCVTAGFFQEYPNTDREEFYETVPGVSDIENSETCSANSIFRIAGLSESIQALLITAKFVEEGRLSLDDDIHRWLPESVFPVKYWNGEKAVITLRQLLAHRSGIRDVTFQDLLHYWEGMSIANTTDILSVFANDPLEFQPGTAYLRSRHGINLIAAIIEQLEHRPYADVYNEYTDNATMWNTKMESPTDYILRRVTQYQSGNDSAGNFRYLHAPVADNLRPYPHWSAEGSLSYVGDILDFCKTALEIMLGRDDYLSKETLQEFWNSKYITGTTSLTINGTKVDNIETSTVLGFQRLDFPTVVDELPKLSNLSVIYQTSQFNSTGAVLAIMPEKIFSLSVVTNLGGIDQKLEEFVLESFLDLYNPE